MDSQDQRSAVSFVLSVLRKITRAAKFLPFLYLAVFGLVSICEVWTAEEQNELINTLLYIPPPIVFLSLFLSKILKLCIWHKTACLIPTLSQIEGFIDQYVFQFTQEEIVLINTSIGVISIAFIFIAYRKIFYGTKAGNKRSL